jgi:hypothetical protein
MITARDGGIEMSVRPLRVHSRLRVIQLFRRFSVLLVYKCATHNAFRSWYVLSCCQDNHFEIGV